MSNKNLNPRWSLLGRCCVARTTSVEEGWTPFFQKHTIFQHFHAHQTMQWPFDLWICHVFHSFVRHPSVLQVKATVLILALKQTSPLHYQRRLNLESTVYFLPAVSKFLTVPCGSPHIKGKEQSENRYLFTACWHDMYCDTHTHKHCDIS